MAEEIGARRVTRFMKGLLDVLWWVGLIGGGILSLSTLTHTRIIGVGFSVPPYADVGIHRTSAEVLSLTTRDASDQAQPELINEQARLILRGAPWWLYATFIIGQLFGMAFVLYGIHLLRSLLRHVLDGEVFTEENAFYLSRLAWVVIVGSIVYPITTTLWAGQLIAHATGTGFRLETLSKGPSSSFWLGLIILILAAIWRYGVELQRERDLTV